MPDTPEVQDAEEQVPTEESNPVADALARGQETVDAAVEDAADAVRKATEEDASTESTPPAPDPALVGGGPDAAGEPTMRVQGTAPWGTGGFSLSQHSRCLSAAQAADYTRIGADALPQACRDGHTIR